MTVSVHVNTLAARNRMINQVQEVLFTKLRQVSFNHHTIKVVKKYSEGHNKNLMIALYSSQHNLWLYFETLQREEIMACNKIMKIMIPIRIAPHSIQC